MTRRFALFSLALATMFPQPPVVAQIRPAPLDEQAVRSASDRMQAAVLANDTAAFRQLLAPEYVFITATGAVFNREDVLRIYSAREIAHTVYRADSVQVRVFGDAAVVTALLVKEGRWVAGPRAGTLTSGRFRSTRVYVRRDGRWQVVSTHESQLAS
ncbi:MAG: nuclear transport factor 2 family protein [Gemmatimonadetes bacterium]|nr:nuclear transport factor 2 family protein [Gemmatimonadota bacterium]